MATENEYQPYLDELRASVCSHCIERQPGNPPCSEHGWPCGIELHIPEMVETCRQTDSSLIDPYIQQLHDKICANCQFNGGLTCPCPLDYLLELAVEAIERVESRRTSQAGC